MPADAVVLAPVSPASAPSRGSTLVLTLTDPVELLDAWRRVKRSGGQPGPDGVTIDAFENNLHHNLHELASAVRAGTYRPGRLGRHYLKKKDGGARVIGIPNVGDRVLQAAAADWLHARIEPLLSSKTFAYRPRLGPQRAATYAGRLGAEHAWVIAADVAKYFDSVNHEILLRLVHNLGVDRRDSSLIHEWLRAAPVDRGTTFLTVKGLPQGLTIAPSLANLYLQEFDGELEARNWPHVRFADDFVVFAATEDKARSRLEWMTEYLRTQRQLTFKPSKTSIIPVTRGFDFVGFRIDRECLRLPNDASDRFKASMEERLQRLPHDVEGTVRCVNDLTRGWRAYFGGVSEVLNRQIQVIEAWRRVRVAAALSKANLPQLWLAKMFESLLDLDSARRCFLLRPERLLPTGRPSEYCSQIRWHSQADERGGPPTPPTYS